MSELFIGGKTIELKKYITRYQLAFQKIYRNVNNMIKHHVHTDITTDQFTILQFILQHEQTTSTQIAQTMEAAESTVSEDDTTIVVPIEVATENQPMIKSFLIFVGEVFLCMICSD